MVTAVSAHHAAELGDTQASPTALPHGSAMAPSLLVVANPPPPSYFLAGNRKLLTKQRSEKLLEQLWWSSEPVGFGGNEA